MSQRTRKAASLIQQIVAAEVARLPFSVNLTVTGVDVSPDLRQATVWVGSVGEVGDSFTHLDEARHSIQGVIGSQMTSKFVPRITFKQDTSGQYAQHISKLIDKSNDR